MLFRSPFTTLTPNLGVVSLSNDRSFVVADVPGLIEGAHRGLGLGDRFLRHLERTELLVHIIDISGATGRDPVIDFETVSGELRSYAPELAAKPQLCAANKMDALDDPSRLERLAEHVKAMEIPLFPISAVTGAGVGPLLEAMWKALADRRATHDVAPHEPLAEPIR